jgi:ABC-2 type transport system permease protein
MNGFTCLLRRELAHYFATPIACVVIAAFWATSGFFFSFNVLFVSAMDMVTAFHNMSLLFLLMMPLLSMRTFAEERQLHTLELLLTLPFAEGVLVLSKYVALLIVLTIMLAGSAVALFPLAWFGAPDFGPIIGGYVGVFLLAAAFGAIGLAVSSWAANQIVAAVLTWAVLLFLWFADYGIALNLPAEVNQWLQHLSFSAQYLDLIRGVIPIGAVIYFLSVVAFGLLTATQALRAARA